MKSIIIFLFLASILFSKTDSTYKISAELLGGSSIYSIGVYDEPDMNIIGFSGGLRLLWEPDKLLRVGLESGFIHLAHSKEENIETEFGVTRRTNSLNAYPVLLIFNMKLWYFEGFLGLGGSYIASKINAFGDVSESSVFTSCKLYGIGFSHKLFDRLYAGAEFKYYSFSTPEVVTGIFQLKVKYELFEW